MKYESEQQRCKANFLGWCEDIEKLIEKGWAKPHMLERYSPGLGIIALYRHYDPERADKILEHARTVALEHYRDSNGG